MTRSRSITLFAVSTTTAMLLLVVTVVYVALPAIGRDLHVGFDGEGFSPGWLTIGGTSLSSPVVTALFALAGGAREAAYPAATLYGHLGQSSALYDVTSGGNGYCDSEANLPCGEPEVNELLGNVDCQGTTACDAAKGFDGPSGVGAPLGLTAAVNRAPPCRAQELARSQCRPRSRALRRRPCTTSASSRPARPGPAPARTRS
jgi:hypothetical protein